MAEKKFIAKVTENAHGQFAAKAKTLMGMNHGKKKSIKKHRSASEVRQKMYGKS